MVKKSSTNKRPSSMYVYDESEGLKIVERWIKSQGFASEDSSSILIVYLNENAEVRGIGVDFMKKWIHDNWDKASKTAQFQILIETFIELGHRCQRMGVSMTTQQKKLKKTMNWDFESTPADNLALKNERALEKVDEEMEDDFDEDATDEVVRVL